MFRQKVRQEHINSFGELIEIDKSVTTVFKRTTEFDFLERFLSLLCYFLRRFFGTSPVELLSEPIRFSEKS